MIPIDNIYITRFTRGGSIAATSVLSWEEIIL